MTILAYHRVVREPDPLIPGEVCAADFRLHMETVSRWFTVLSLKDAVRRLRERSLPVRAACVTFDDGYADNAQVALPILLAHGIPATFYVATGFIEGGCMWNDSVVQAVRSAPGAYLDASAQGLGRLDISSPETRRRALGRLLDALKYLPLDARTRQVEALLQRAGKAQPSNLMMNATQIRQLHANGMEIGAHTASHPILAKLGIDEAAREIAEGKERLEAITGEPVSTFAYPNGKPNRDYLAEHVALVKRLGFDAAVSTVQGVADGTSDLYQLPRFMPWHKSGAKLLIDLAANTFRAPSEQVPS